MNDTITLDPERIRMDADLEMRKAKAKLDQIPDYAPDHERMRKYLRFVTIGTALAIRQNQEEGWPVPVMAFPVEPFSMSSSAENPIYRAWADIDGNECSEVGMFSPGVMTLHRVPIYEAVNDQHKAINLYLIGDKDWFTKGAATVNAYREEIRQLNQTVMTCQIILNELEAFTNDKTEGEEPGAGSPEQEWVYPW